MKFTALALIAATGVAAKNETTKDSDYMKAFDLTAYEGLKLDEALKLDGLKLDEFGKIADFGKIDFKTLDPSVFLGAPKELEKPSSSKNYTDKVEVPQPEKMMYEEGEWALKFEDIKEGILEFEQKGFWFAEEEKMKNYTKEVVEADPPKVNYTETLKFYKMYVDAEDDIYEKLQGFYKYELPTKWWEKYELELPKVEYEMREYDKEYEMAEKEFEKYNVTKSPLYKGLVYDGEIFEEYGDAFLYLAEKFDLEKGNKTLPKEDFEKNYTASLPVDSTPDCSAVSCVMIAECADGKPAVVPKGECCPACPTEEEKNKTVKFSFEILKVESEMFPSHEEAYEFLKLGKGEKYEDVDFLGGYVKDEASVKSWVEGDFKAAEFPKVVEEWFFKTDFSSSTKEVEVPAFKKPNVTVPEIPSYDYSELEKNATDSLTKKEFEGLFNYKAAEELFSFKGFGNFSSFEKVLDEIKLPSLYSYSGEKGNKTEEGMMGMSASSANKTDIEIEEPKNKTEAKGFFDFSGLDLKDFGLKGFESSLKGLDVEEFKSIGDLKGLFDVEHDKNGTKKQLPLPDFEVSKMTFEYEKELPSYEKNYTASEKNSTVTDEKDGEEKKGFFGLW